MAATVPEGGDLRPEPGGGTDVFAADDGIGRDLAAVDWRATPLGAPGDWPQSLQTAVSILLSSRFSMWMAWGPELTFFCNAAYRKDTLGRKYPWALGRSAREVWSEIWDDIGPRVDTVLSTGRATWDEALLLFLERSGYPEETYHTFSYSPLRDNSGEVVGMLCVVREDTERVIGERRMATLRDLGSDPSVVRTDEETLAFAGRQLGRNLRDLPFSLTYLFQDDGSARLAGATGIPTGHPAAPELLDGGERDVWPAAALERGEPVLVDLDPATLPDLPTGDWPEPPAQALLVPLLRQGSSPYGFLVAALNRYRPLDEGYRGFLDLVAGHVAAGIASARSYRAQQQRADELAELDRAKTTFFSNVSHEFRTPLTLIMGPLEELRVRLAGADERVRQELEAIHRNGLRLSKLVNTLLDFSRIEAGRMQAHFTPVDLSVVLAELASVFRSAVDSAGLTFDVDCPPLPEPVHIDPGMWEKVILNLLSNALKFTFDGSIRIAVRSEGRHAVVTVADTGTGVPAEEMPRLFERFHRIENARSRSNEGSGIGLALAKELVALHGGTISADSTEGEGTSFTIRLPFGTAHLPAGPPEPAGPTDAAVTSAAAPYVQEAHRWLPAGEPVAPALHAAVDPSGAAVPAAASGPVPPTPARVLVADDNADMREYLTRILRDAGYRVSTARDGQEALESVRADAPDLLVSDVMMPRRDGLSLVGALRADPRTAAVPVLLLSAKAGQEASIDGLQAGADDYLVKPFAAAELLARVRANAELARLRSHHARWRTALVDSMQEAFFVCDEAGAVIEINAAFTEILGHRPDELPFAALHPWWPDAETDPEAHREVAEAFGTLLREGQGRFTVPVTHRDGHRLWISVAYNHARDPDTGRRVTVGTFRDVTAEHHAVQRQRALASLSTTLAQATSLPQALAGALGELREMWRAEQVIAAVFVPHGDPALTVSSASSGGETSAPQTSGSETPAPRAPDPDAPDSETPGRPSPVCGPGDGSAALGATWPDLPEERRRVLTDLSERPLLTPTSTRNGAGVLLEHPDGPMALWIDLGEHRPFSEEDQLLLSLLAGRLAQGLVRAHQIDQQRDTAIALQRAILGPAQLPDGFAVRYEPASRPLEVGGDWYDTFALPDGRIGIVVGDCVGRGLQAATVMGQLRSACRALLLQDASPAATLMALDHFAAGIPGALCTTVFCGVLVPETGQLTYSSAGHPPGIVVSADGRTHLLDGGRSVPLAVRPGRPRPEGRHTLPARATLMLYTDGLVERRRRSLDVGIEEAGRAVREGRDAAVDDLADRVMTRLAPADGYDDDVALLLYRHPAPLDVAFPAHSAELAPVRQALRGWLSQCQVPSRLAQGVLVAAGEACANAVEHGHRDAPGGTVRLRAEAFADNLRLTVSDTGSWRTPQPAENSHRGRGMGLMRALMQHVSVTRGVTGTTVDMHTRIS